MQTAELLGEQELLDDYDEMSDIDPRHYLKKGL